MLSGSAGTVRNQMFGGPASLAIPALAVPVQPIGLRCSSAGLVSDGTTSTRPLETLVS